MDQVWVNRAVSAEAAVTGRHLKRLWALPGTQLGVVAWPPARRDRWFGGWHYWWQAHLLDCLVDAEQRDPQPERRIKIERQIHSHRLRNNGSWVNNYYDDMAWLALALERASRVADVDRERALQKLERPTGQSMGARRRRRHPVAQAGPVLQRPGQRPRRDLPGALRRPAAACPADGRLDRRNADRPQRHLVFDGIKAGSLVRAEYTYCQGVVLGLETELAARTDDDRHAPRVHRLVAAVEDHMAPGGVLRGAGGGDGGLFAGITARYLALVATTLPATLPTMPTTRETAREIVLTRHSGLGQPPDGGGAATVRAVLGSRPPSCRRPAGSRRSSSRARSQLRRSPSVTYQCSCPVGC